MKVLVTGGCGFIGSAVVREAITTTRHDVINVDKMTYAATQDSVSSVANSERYSFVRADIVDAKAVEEIFEYYRPDTVIHLAAESHVDRSIDGPSEFVNTNLLGTFNLLQAARSYPVKRFHHVSTDEVYGSLDVDDPSFTEESPYGPRSPYSATKAGSDHLVRAWHETFDLPVTITNCSNNYGPFQFPEKLIPLVIIRALGSDCIPVYGAGENVRDWLYVQDHAQAILKVMDEGREGETYNVGGNSERRNLDVVRLICDILDERRPRPDGSSHSELIEFVRDRPGHDLRYAVDSTKIESELGWVPSKSFEAGIDATISWYLDNQSWWRPLLSAEAVERRGKL